MANIRINAPLNAICGKTGENIGNKEIYVDPFICYHGQKIVRSDIVRKSIELVTGIARCATPYSSRTRHVCRMQKVHIETRTRRVNFAKDGIAQRIDAGAQMMEDQVSLQKPAWII